MSSELLPGEDPALETGAKLEVTEPPRYIRFGPFQIDQQRQQVYQNGTRLKLQGKVYQALLVLVLRQGEIVTREELKQALWSADTFVNYDANVNTTVNKLRQVLGDSTDKPIYIETIPRKGYTFVGQVEFSDTPFTFPVATPEAANGRGSANPGEAENAATHTIPKKWITLGVIILIAAGILAGAGIATLLMSHFGAGGRLF
jgi:DNA-binding winged helix-turn-helix (wHTH) protein